MVPSQELRSLLFNLKKISKSDKSTVESCRMHWNLMNDEKFESFKCLLLKYKRGNQIIQLFCRIGSPLEIRSLLCIFKFSISGESTADSLRTHWNLTNDKEFGSFKRLILKYRRGDLIIQAFPRIGSPQELRYHLFNLKKIWKSDKSTAES